MHIKTTLVGRIGFKNTEHKVHTILSIRYSGGWSAFRHNVIENGAEE